MALVADYNQFTQILLFRSFVKKGPVVEQVVTLGKTFQKYS